MACQEQQNGRGEAIRRELPAKKSKGCIEDLYPVQ
jgi:hypothetical protein